MILEKSIVSFFISIFFIDFPKTSNNATLFIVIPFVLTYNTSLIGFGYRLIAFFKVISFTPKVPVISADNVGWVKL